MTAPDDASPPPAPGFEPRVAIASLSGEADAEWALAAAGHVGAAFLGGIALDRPAREAAREMVARGRDEFLPADPIEFIDRELSRLDGASLQPAFNVRSTTVEPVREAAAVCRDHDAILEVNAHCRQDELCAVGCGETLLRETERLCRYVEAAADTGARVSVKVRTEVAGVDLPETARRVSEAGADLVHVDAMDSEPVVAEVARATAAAVIANNGVRDRATVHEYLGYGAAAVSVGRPSDDPAVLSRVRRATDAWFEEVPTTS